MLHMKWLSELSSKKGGLIGTWWASILASLGLMVNTFVFMIFSNQKGAFNNTVIILIAFMFLLCMVLLGLVIRKYILLKKFKHRLNHISELEEAIYDEVLKLHLD